MKEPSTGKRKGRRTKYYTPKTKRRRTESSAVVPVKVPFTLPPNPRRLQSSTCFGQSSVGLEPTLDIGKMRDSQLVAADSNVILQDREMLDGVALAQNEQHDDPEDETGLSGAVAKAEGRVYKLLDELTELLSQENEGLDRDKLVSLLSERLQIKPLNISTAGNLDKPRREIAVSLTDRMDGHEMTGHPTIRSSAPEEHPVDSCDKYNENNAQEPPAVIMKEEPSSSKVKRRQRRGCKIYRPKSKAKAKTPLLNERKSRAYSQGQSKSFAGAVGSSHPTEAGLMCSTRIRSRRLEFKK